MIVGGEQGGWTAERIETAVRMWSDGSSASEIVRALGGAVSRNAVIGKVHRLGLKRSTPAALEAMRLGATQKRQQRAKASEDRKGRRSEQKASPSAGSREAVSSARLRAVSPDQPLPPASAGDVARITEPKHHHCRWPVGDPKDPSFGFCGSHSGEAVYCPDHTLIAVDRTRPALSRGTLSWMVHLDTTKSRSQRDRGPWADAA